MELGRIINHKIIIEPTDNKGFCVRVGCGKFVFNNINDLQQGLKEYLSNPEEIEKDYNKIQTTECETASESKVLVPPFPSPSQGLAR